jgi:hypothetical protein
MKKYIIMLFILNNVIVAQNLKLEEIISFQKKKISEVEEYLTAKGWEIFISKIPSEDRLGELTYTYQKNTFEDKAQAFLHYYYNKNTRRISLQIHKKEKYNEYVSRAKLLGYKQKKTTVEEGQLVKTYIKDNQVLMTQSVVNTDEFGKTEVYYIIGVLSYDDFAKEFPQYDN